MDWAVPYRCACGNTRRFQEILWEQEEEIDAQRLLSELLPQIYDRTTFIPKEVHLPLPIEGGGQHS